MRMGRCSVDVSRVLVDRFAAFPPAALRMKGKKKHREL
jgi:hypothetical protein